MQKLKNETLQNFLDKFIKELQYEAIRTCSEIERKKFDIPFIVSALYQSFKNDEGDYKDYIKDLKDHPDYTLSIENSRNDYSGIIDVFIHLSPYTSHEKDDYYYDVVCEPLNYEYLLSFTYDERNYEYCMCTPDMPDYREDKHCCGHGCDATFCEFSLQKISYIKRDYWHGDEHDYWDFEDEFYKSDEELAEKKREEDRERTIQELRNRIEEYSKKLKELEGDE